MTNMNEENITDKKLAEEAGYLGKCISGLYGLEIYDFCPQNEGKDR